MKYVQDRFLTGLVRCMYRWESHTPWCWSATQEDGYCSAFNSSFVSSFCYSRKGCSENMSLRDPNQSWASSLWDHRDTCIETLTARVLTLLAQQIENHINTSRPVYNQANLSQVTEIHINKQENNNADVAKFINCKSSSREEKVSLFSSSSMLIRFGSNNSCQRCKFSVIIRLNSVHILKAN